MKRYITEKSETETLYTQSNQAEGAQARTGARVFVTL